MENYVGKICPFCRTEITETDAVKVCPACGIPHHEGCWNENRGCTTFGCSEQHYEEQHTNPSSVCTRCGNPLGDSEAFCPKCGAPKNAPKKNVCTSCGAELMDGQAFCEKCGCKVGVAVDNNLNAAINQFNANISKQKTKSKKLPIIIVVAVVIVAILGGIIGSIVKEKRAEEAEKRKQEAVEEYVEDAASFYTKILSYGGTMEDIGNEIQKSWRAYVTSSYYNGSRYYSVDSAIAAALSYMSSDVSRVKNAQSSIESLYRSLLSVPDASNQELQEIKAAVKVAYNAYQDMYDCVITPSGNYNSWTSEFGDVDSELADAIGDLRTLIN